MENGEKEGFNTLVYRESEIERIAEVAPIQRLQRRGPRILFGNQLLLAGLVWLPTLGLVRTCLALAALKLCSVAGLATPVFWNSRTHRVTTIT